MIEFSSILQNPSGMGTSPTIWTNIKIIENVDENIQKRRISFGNKDEKISEYARLQVNFSRDLAQPYAVKYNEQEMIVIEKKQRALTQMDYLCLGKDSLYRLNKLEKNSSDSLRYYVLACLFIETHVNGDKVLLFNEEQERIMKLVSESPPKFPIVKISN